MNFINRLTESEESLMLSRLIGPARMVRSFNGIPIGDITFSIQASYVHYCTPRLTLKDLADYETMEFALLRNGDFKTVTELLPTFPRLKEVEKHGDTVYSYVPVDLIEEIYQALLDVERKEFHKRVIRLMEEKLEYYKMLAKYTKKTVKLNKHLFNIKFQEEIIKEYREECEGANEHGISSTLKV